MYNELEVIKNNIMANNLATFLLRARTRRRLTQQQLANIAQVNLESIGTVERGTRDTWTPRIATSIGLALHEVEELTPAEMADFFRFAEVPSDMFQRRPQLSEREREYRVLKPTIDRIVDKIGVSNLLAFLAATEALALSSGERAEDEPTLRHVSQPRARPDLGGVEQVITEYARVKQQPDAKAKLKKGG